MSIYKAAVSFCKNLLPMRLMYFIKYKSKLDHKKQLNIDGCCRRIFFLDSPHYGNIGDQAIAYSIQKFAERYFSDYRFVDIQQEDFPYYLDYLKREIKEDDIIFLTGGGNMGNVYRIFEAARRTVIREFPHIKTIVFPQTIDYSDNIFGKLSSRQSQRIYSKHRSLIIGAREERSYEKMRALYYNNYVVLCPDMVLSLDVEVHPKQRQGIGVCLRSDHEQQLTAKDREIIQKELRNLGEKTREITTSVDIPYITSDMRPTVVLSKINEISELELLVTDRLHAMIFAALGRTPCIVFNTTNKKTEGVAKWLSFCRNIKFVGSVSEFAETIHSIDYNSNDSVNDRSEFDEFARCIREH